MRTRLFILSVLVLLAALLAFCACGTNPAGVSDASDASGDFESAAESSSCAPEFSDVSEESIPASSGGESETSAETSSDISDTGDTSDDTSGGEEEPVLKNPDYEYLATQLEEPFAVWDKLSPATVTVENPYTDNERWKLWWGETCLYTFGEGTWVYSVSGGDQIYALTLFTDGGPAVVTDRDGKTVELTQARPCALLNAEGEVIIPFGEYERLEPVSADYVAATVCADEAYILNGMGERISERYASIASCPSRKVSTTGACAVHITETSGEAYGLRLTQTGELEKVPAHTPPGEHEAPNAYVYDTVMQQIAPFFEALKTGDRTGIIAVIGEERYNKAAALVDTLEPDYEPYQDYTTKPLEEQDADKYMAWILKYARYMNSIPATIFYCEDISDIASQPTLRADVNFHGFTDMIFAVAHFAIDDTNEYPLIDFYMGRTYFPSVD